MVSTRASSRWYTPMASRRLGFLLLLLGPVATWANDDGSLALRKAVDGYLQHYIQGLPGKASYSLESLNARGLVPCTAFAINPAPGSPPWGRVSLRVSCTSGANWSMIANTRVRLFAPYVTVARPVAAGQSIDAADLQMIEGDLSELPASTVIDTQQAIGRIARSPLSPGRPLRQDMLKAPLVVQQGQSVKVVSRGAGFEVANEGKALANAAAGQVVQVKLGSGQIVSGVADNAGNVEVNF